VTTLKKELLYASLALLGAVTGLFVWSSTVVSFVPALETPSGLVEPSTLLLLLGAVISVFLLTQAVEMRPEGASDGEPTDFSPLREVEGVGEAELEDLEKEDERVAIGEEFDVALARTIDTSLNEEERKERCDRVRDHLRETAAMRYSEVTGVRMEEAEEVVGSGDWTDDLRASGFLADENEGSVPLKVWLLDVLVGRDPFVQGVEASVRGIEQLGEGA